MPKKKTASKKSVKQSTPNYSFQVFTENRFKLQLIVIAFIVLSSLLVVHIVKDQEELRTYREVMAASSSR